MNARHKDEEQSLESLLSDSLSAVLGLVLTLRSRAPAAALLSLIPTYDLSQVGSKVDIRNVHRSICGRGGCMVRMLNFQAAKL